MNTQKLDKRFTVLTAALCALVIAILAVQAGCCTETEATRIGPVPVSTFKDPPIEPAAEPLCGPPIADDAVVQACQDGWAIVDDWPVYLMSFEELARSRAVLFYCAEPAHPVVAHVRKQTLAWVKDGQMAIDCGAADYVIVFP